MGGREREGAGIVLKGRWVVEKGRGGGDSFKREVGGRERGGGDSFIGEVGRREREGGAEGSK